MMEWMFDPNVWMALAALTALEIVLGIDNIIFIAILAGKLPENQQEKGRTIGLGLAMITRIVLLFSITLVMKLSAPLFTFFAIEISGRDIVVIAGGLFLLGKSTLEIHSSLEGEENISQDGAPARAVSFSGIIIQIMLLDIVFSLDSVITAIGLANQLAIMVAAIVIAVLFMLLLAGKISEFVGAHPTIKILALSFLMLIGFSLVGEGFDLHIPKGYIYFAMAFSVFVELLNLKLRKRQTAPVKLRQSRLVEKATERKKK